MPLVREWSVISFVLDVVGAIVGFPLLWLGFVLATLAEGLTRLGSWLMGIEYEEGD